MSAFLAAADELLRAAEPTSLELDELCDELFRTHTREEIEALVAELDEVDPRPARRRR